MHARQEEHKTRGVIFGMKLMSVYSRYIYNRNLFIIHYVAVAAHSFAISLELYNLPTRMAMAQGRYKQEVELQFYEKIPLELHFARVGQINCLALYSSRKCP